MNKTAISTYHPIRTSIDLSGAGVDVQRCAPPKHLAAFVYEFWQYKVSHQLDILPMQVFPSGCVSLRFNITPHNVDSFVYGPSTNNNMKSLFFSEWTIFGVTFHPGRAGHLLGLSLLELRDLRIHLEDFWPKPMRDLNDQMWDTNTFDDRTELLAQFLHTNLRLNAEPRPDFLAILHERLNLAHKFHDVTESAKRHQVSPRTMRRHYHQHLGLGPKQMDRVIRTQQAMRTLLTSKEDGIAALAEDCGYSDQPHLTREFQDIVGISPSRFRSLQGRIEDKTLPEWSDLDPAWRCNYDFKRAHKFE